MRGYITIRRGRFSFLAEKKALITLLFIFVIAFAVFVISAGIGSLYISPIEVVNTLLGNGSKAHELTLFSLRIPRLLVAVLVGTSLAAAGAILQGIIRNPLASPDMMGITGGASAAAVAFIALFTGDNLSYTMDVSIKWLPLAAFTGAMIVGLSVYFLAWKNGVTPMRLVLIGVGVASGMSSLTTLLLVKSPSVYSASEAYIWLTGSIYGSNWKTVSMLLPWTCLLVPVAIIYARRLHIHQLGDDVAASVGGRVERERFILLLLSIALAGTAVAAGGAIGFVGLMAPHIARRLVGASPGMLLPASMFIGAVLVMTADLIGRVAFPPFDIPCGVFVSAIGAPFFIFLLYRNRNRS